MEVSKISDVSETKVFGFWVYLMTDLVIFAVLFACFIVLHNNTFGGPSAKELFHLPSMLAETLILLTSSFTCSLAMLAVRRGLKNLSIIWFIITFLLGVSFLCIEISEFTDFVERGASWQRSAFLSSFFTLVGTHGFHISVGLLWMLVMLFRIAFRPLSKHSVSRIFRMALFWHFLDFVWIFIFTVVYGMGYLL
ncbi:MAG: cytochrome o ubiquinol oxidase subunit III [Chlamydiales bacterium]|nr:cytochrome o ubiquinol oxidase subunit III [Chlamydiales bacterium]